MGDGRHPSQDRLRWVVMGVSGCGKSAVGAALAALLGVRFHEGDSDHPPESLAKMAAGIALTDDDRQPWLHVLQGRLRAAAESNEGLVISCSALKRRYRDLLRQGDPALLLVYLDGSPELIAARMAQRTGHFMPPSLLHTQLRDLEPPQADERAVRLDIVDPPGTLARKARDHFALPPGRGTQD